MKHEGHDRTRKYSTWVTETQEMNGFPPADNEMGSCCAFTSSTTSTQLSFVHLVLHQCPIPQRILHLHHPLLILKLPLQCLLFFVWDRKKHLPDVWDFQFPICRFPIADFQDFVIAKAISDAFGLNVQSPNTGDLTLTRGFDAELIHEKQGFSMTTMRIWRRRAFGFNVQSFNTISGLHAE